MGLGPYAVFIATAYAAAGVIVTGLVAWVILDRRRLLRNIEEIEAQGIGRRSDRRNKETP